MNRPSQEVGYTVAQTILSHALLCEGDCVFVALSGGADSVALLHLLLSWKKIQRITVCAAHVNHGLRGEESDREEAFVRCLCAEKNVPLFVKKEHMKEKKKPNGLGVEAWARQLRYTFFEQLALENDAKVATGHTASDNAETILFHAIRGSFTAGLSGISPKRGRYIRPLLALSRQEVRAYCEKQGHAYCNDSSNEDTMYTRNLLRISAMPLLEKAHTGAEKNLYRLAEDMRELHEFLQDEARELLQAAKRKAEAVQKTPGWYIPAYDMDTLKNAPRPVRKEAFAMLAGTCATRDSLLRMEAVLQKKQAVVQLAEGQFVRLQRTRFIVSQVESKEAIPQEWPLQEGTFEFLGYYKITISVMDKSDFVKNREIIEKKDYFFLADYDKINQSCIFRTRRLGDSFSPLGRGVRKSIKKWMQEVEIDRELRNKLPLLVERDSGQVQWVFGAGFAEGLCVQKQTQRVLCIETCYQRDIEEETEWDTQ